MKIVTLAFACLLLAVGHARAGIYVTLSDKEWGSVNVSTGVFTPLGMSPVQMGDIAINPITQQSYGIGFDNSLYAINTANGSGVIMGPSVYTNNLVQVSKGAFTKSTATCSRSIQRMARSPTWAFLHPLPSSTWPSMPPTRFSPPTPPICTRELSAPPVRPVCWEIPASPRYTGWLLKTTSCMASARTMVSP